MGSVRRRTGCCPAARISQARALGPHRQLLLGTKMGCNRFILEWAQQICWFNLAARSNRVGWSSGFPTHRHSETDTAWSRRQRRISIRVRGVGTWQGMCLQFFGAVSHWLHHTCTWTHRQMQTLSIAAQQHTCGDDEVALFWGPVGVVGNAFRRNRHHLVCICTTPRTPWLMTRQGWRV
jgi:hypothetical protein